MSDTNSLGPKFTSSIKSLISHKLMNNYFMFTIPMFSLRRRIMTAYVSKKIKIRRLKILEFSWI
jgi:hypothetical protein